MEAFQGVFTKRGESDVSAAPATGAFEEVFVRRGRWRKSPVEIAQQNEVHMADGLNMPEQSKADTTSPFKMLHQIDIKNTFINTKALDFDSLQDFLKERQVKSCPASRQGSGVTTLLIDDLLANTQMEEVLNTASSLGDIPVLFATQKEAELFDDACSMPSGSTGSGDVESSPGSGDSESAPNEEMLNTGDFDLLHQHMTADAADEMQALTADRLQSLRMQESSIQQSVSQIAQSETQPSPMISARGQQSPNQFIVAIQTADGIRPGLVTLLNNSQAEQQPQFPTPPPTEPPLLDGLLPMCAAPPPMAAPVAAAPVLRLAEAIATPEVGTPELPSIGSLLHHKGECKPCTFFHTRGCENGKDCKFCHLCPSNEKKKRIKAQKAAQRVADFVALENAKAALACFRAAEERGLQVETIVE